MLSNSIMSNSATPWTVPHGLYSTRLLCPWNSPGKNTEVGCHFLLQRMKVKSESEVAQSCPTLSDPLDCSPPGSSAHGIFQAGALGVCGYMYRYVWVPLVFTWNCHSIVNQLYPKTKWKVYKKTLKRAWTSLQGITLCAALILQPSPLPCRFQKPHVAEDCPDCPGLFMSPK